MERLGEVVMRFLEAPPRPGETPLRVVPNLEKTFFDYYYRGAYDEFWAQDCCSFCRSRARATRRSGRSHIAAAPAGWRVRPARTARCHWSGVGRGGTPLA